METTSLPGRVQLSAAAAELLQREMPLGLALEPRGQIAVKGKVRRKARCQLPQSRSPEPFGTE